MAFVPGEVVPSIVWGKLRCLLFAVVVVAKQGKLLPLHHTLAILNALS